MSRRRLKARDKVTQKMSRDGLVERNETKGEDIRISKREAEVDLRGGTQERQSLVGARPEDMPDSRKKAKQRQIEAFQDKETIQPVHSDTVSINKPSSDVLPSRSTIDIPNDIPVQRSEQDFSQTTQVLPVKETASQRLEHEPQPTGISVTHKSETAALRSEPATESIIHDVPDNNIPVSVNPRDPPQRDSLSQVDTRPDEKTGVSQKTSLRHDKPAVLMHEPMEAPDTTETKPRQTNKLKTQKDSVLQHDIPVEPALITETITQSEQQPQTGQEYTENILLDGADQNPAVLQDGKGKLRVQGNTAYRQKQLGIPLIEPVIPVSPSVLNDAQPTHPVEVISVDAPKTDVAPGQADAFADITSSTNNKAENTAEAPSSQMPPVEIPSPQKPTDDKPDSRLTPDKPGKLRFNADETVPDTPKGKPDRKLIRAERQSARANAKLEKAKNNLPGKKKLRPERVYDEQTGKSTQKLRFDKEITPQGEQLKGALPLRPVKTVTNIGIAKFHTKMYQAEHENVEVKAAHRAEMAAESGVRSALRFRKTAKYRKVAKLEQQAAKKSINLSRRKALANANNPKLKSNMFSRMWQKRKIRKDYAKKARDAKRAAGAAKKTGSAVVKATRFIAKAVVKNPKVLIIAGIIGFIILILMSLFSLAASIGSGGLSVVLTSTYLAENEEIEAAALAYSEWETDLRLEILNVETSHPGFDEYRFDIGNIGHCPIELMAFLTAVHHDFTFDEVQAYMQALFDEQYTLTFTPTTEIRFTPPTEPGGAPVPYDWQVMTVTLTARPFTEVLMSNMAIDQQMHFAVLLETKGYLQIVGSPFDFNWQPFISSHYGWRVHPISGERNLHRGIDIGLPTGTPIRAAHGGVVTVAEYMGGFGNVVFVVGENGIETRYAHADTISVSVGDTVEMGDIIATVGSTGDSTGPHLHFEVLVDGTHVNPAFYAFMGG